MTKAQRVPYYLAHMVQALERIARYTQGMDQAAFEADELVQDAVLRNIENGRSSQQHPALCARFCGTTRPHSLAGDVHHAQPRLAWL